MSCGKNIYWFSPRNTFFNDIFEIKTKKITFNIFIFAFFYRFYPLFRVLSVLKRWLPAITRGCNSFECFPDSPYHVPTFRNGANLEQVATFQNLNFQKLLKTSILNHISPLFDDWIHEQPLKKFRNHFAKKIDCVRKKYGYFLTLVLSSRDFHQLSN